VDIQGDYSKFCISVEKYGKARTELKRKFDEKIEYYKNTTLGCQNGLRSVELDQKKPLELVDDYFKWEPIDNDEKALKAELKEIIIVKKSHQELTQLLQTYEDGGPLKGTCHICVKL
jgi:hypothetical protein